MPGSRRVSRAGASVCLWARDRERNEDVAGRLRAGGADVEALVCDVTDEASITAATTQTIDQFGQIDACFANAGGTRLDASFLELSLDAFRSTTRLNLEGTFLTLQAVARRMVAAQRGGSLVAVSSLAAHEGMPRGQHYAAAKAGIEALVRSCAVELGAHGIRVNAIVPGWIETPATGHALARPSLQQAVRTRVPLGRWGTPADLASVAVYLAADGSAYRTGDTLTVDGGYRHF